MRVVVAKSPPSLMHPETFARLCRSRDFLAQSFSAPVSLGDAARQARLSPYHFQRLFTRAFGQTPHDFLTSRRIDRARELLASSDLPVTEICLEIGYSSLGSFSSRFRQLVGCPPSAFRARHRSIFRIPWPAHRFIPACFLLFHGAPLPPRKPQF